MTKRLARLKCGRNSPTGTKSELRHVQLAKGKTGQLGCPNKSRQGRHPPEAMSALGPLFIGWLMGAVAGFLVSIPVGPINVTIVNDGAQRGLWWGFWIGLGAVAMEVTYCAIAFAGFTGLFTGDVVRAVMELASFLLMIFLGFKYLLAKSLPATLKTVEMVEHRFHPHTAFMIGYVRVMGNPGVLLFWITISATFIAHNWMDDTWSSKIACVLGVGVGALAWFVLLSYGAALGHGKFSTQTLIRLSHVSGASLLIVALVLGGRLVDLLAKSEDLKHRVRKLEQKIERPLNSLGLTNSAR
jgi:threonine/homoserine/homoserine lactone efflux protein